MLVDIPNLDLDLNPVLDPVMRAVLGVISQGDINPRHIGTGAYQVGHWNFEEFIRDRLLDQYPEAHVDEPEWDCIGVCDRPEQVIAKYPFLVTSPRSFVISFVQITKASQPSSGGWRWSKWGSYIGDQDPQWEYLHDEPDIDEVWTFHIYEVKCPICGKDKGQPPERCNGHYDPLVPEEASHA